MTDHTPGVEEVTSPAEAVSHVTLTVAPASTVPVRVTVSEEAGAAPSMARVGGVMS